MEQAAPTTVRVNKVKSQMALHGLTYATMAEILGTKKATLHSKLVGRRKFNHDELQRLSEYFGVKIDYFLCD